MRKSLKRLEKSVKNHRLSEKKQTNFIWNRNIYLSKCSNLLKLNLNISKQITSEVVKQFVIWIQSKRF